MKPKEHVTHHRNVPAKKGQQTGTVPLALVYAAPFLCLLVDLPFQKTAPTSRILDIQALTQPLVPAVILLHRPIQAFANLDWTWTILI